jgi:L-lactate dehydrogenase complex protein LldG
VSAREEVLARIGTAHRSAPPPELSYDAIERRYRTASDRGPHELAERLVDRLLDYRALVRRCVGDEIAGTIASALSGRGAGAVVVPPGLDPSWLGQAGTSIRTDGGSVDQQLSVAQLDATDGVITSCAVAIAETGTLILDGSADQGRRVITLIPDYHLCVVLSDQIVADVPQALGRLTPSRPLTMISGPSATSDIELNRVEGVHGPRTLEVIIVDPPTASDDRGETA